MTHEDAFDLLPWYLNGTLAAPERRLVAAHLASCAECVAELQLLERVVTDMAAQREAEPVASANRLQWVLERIRAEPHVVPIGQARTRVRRPAWWVATPWPARLALAAQLLLAIGLGIWVGVLAGDRGFGTATGGADADGPRVAVAFQPGVSEAQLRERILELGGRIVDGPTAAGLYHVALDIAPDSVSAVRRVVEALRRDTAIVRLAEVAR